MSLNKICFNGKKSLNNYKPEDAYTYKKLENRKLICKSAWKKVSVKSDIHIKNREIEN
jgi:hypothetical protein